jgi:hypothetical protein
MPLPRQIATTGSAPCLLRPTSKCSAAISMPWIRSSSPAATRGSTAWRSSASPAPHSQANPSPQDHQSLSHDLLHHRLLAQEPLPRHHGLAAAARGGCFLRHASAGGCGAGHHQHAGADQHRRARPGAGGDGKTRHLSAGTRARGHSGRGGVPLAHEVRPLAGHARVS